MASWRWRVCLCFPDISQQCDPASGNWSKWFSSLLYLAISFYFGTLPWCTFSERSLQEEKDLHYPLPHRLRRSRWKSSWRRLLSSWEEPSPLTFLSISWVLRFSMRPISSISSLSLNSFKVVALTSQDGGGVHGWSSSLFGRCQCRHLKKKVH